MELFDDEKTSVRKRKIVSWKEGKSDYQSTVLILVLFAILVWRFITLDENHIGNSYIFDNNDSKILYSKIFIVLSGSAFLFNLWYVLRGLILSEKAHFQPLIELGKMFWGYVAVSLFLIVILCGAFKVKMLWLFLVLLIFFAFQAFVSGLFYLLALFFYLIKRKLEKIKQRSETFMSLKNEQERKKFYSMYMQPGKIRRLFARLKYRFK